MSDFIPFLRSDDFRAYRRKQVEMVASHLKKSSYQMITGGSVDLSALKGKLEMVKLFLRVPETLTNDKQTLELLSVQLDEDVSGITQFLIRQTLAEQE
jgi:hypothetical protein